MHRRPAYVKPRSVKLRNGRVITVKSGLEEKLVLQLESLGVPVEYEKHSISYTVPEREAKYIPDFRLPNGIYVEGKGEFDSKDRQKHELVREQHPHLDIRLVFSSPRTKIYPGSKTTVAQWADQRGIKWATKEIPEEWIKEKKK